MAKSSRQPPSYPPIVATGYAGNPYQPWITTSTYATLISSTRLRPTGRPGDRPWPYHALAVGLLGVAGLFIWWISR